MALIATFGMFMGGAGVVMLLAGHLTATAIALTVAGVVGTVYLVLFLAMDARTSRPTTPPAPRRRVSRPTTGTCSFCGRAFTDEGGLLRSPRATICRSCVEYARATISGTGDQP